MKIKTPAPAEYPLLVDIWAKSVKASHHFLPEEYFLQIRRDLPELYLPGLEVHAAYLKDIAGGGETCAGFMALSREEIRPAAPAKVEMLFVHQGRQGQGLGRALLDFARARYPSLLLDVNEQNPAALAFYLRYGFEVCGRSELDGCGKPFPLLHMRLKTI